MKSTLSKINGENLFTTLDIDVQKVAYDQMDNRRGAVVAIEIDTGSIIRKLASTPSFSTNAIPNGISLNEFNTLLQDNKNLFLIELLRKIYSCFNNKACDWFIWIGK